MNVRFLATSLVLTVGLGLAACSGVYYLVKDPHTGREYYATTVQRWSGGIRFKDEKTQSTVTLQNSEVIEIFKDQYRASTRAR